MKAKRMWVFLFAFVVLAISVAVASRFLIPATRTYAQNDPQRIVTESLGISRDQYLVADLGSFPDGGTKLVLRDSHGRLGLILSVYDHDPNRAKIELFDANGRRVGFIDASTMAVQQLPPISRLAKEAAAAPEEGVRYKFDAARPEDVAYLQSQIDQVRTKLNDAIDRLNTLTK